MQNQTTSHPARGAEQIEKPYTVCVWSHGHLVRVIDFRSKSAALRFARSGDNGLRVLSLSAKAEGLTGESIPAEYYGDHGHGFLGTKKEAR